MLKWFKKFFNLWLPVMMLLADAELSDGLFPRSAHPMANLLFFVLFGALAVNMLPLRDDAL